MVCATLSSTAPAISAVMRFLYEKVPKLPPPWKVKRMPYGWTEERPMLGSWSHSRKTWVGPGVQNSVGFSSMLHTRSLRPAWPYGCSPSLYRLTDTWNCTPVTLAIGRVPFTDRSEFAPCARLSRCAMSSSRSTCAISNHLQIGMEITNWPSAKVWVTASSMSAFKLHVRSPELPEARMSLLWAVYEKLKPRVMFWGATGRECLISL
mmetsp:Transcript_45787/g.115786  ORF Transcript_45787/g.115786 Transcript_45787/m.115786 type:complete len:207 (-) Transcript_45787:234-854(-)